MHGSSQFSEYCPPDVDPDKYRVALRTAFIARFIVLREGKRSRAHRAIEKLTWSDGTNAEDLAQMLIEEFVKNGDKLEPVRRDISRALEHSKRSVAFFLDQYVERSSTTFSEAIKDYMLSNELLFDDSSEEQPRVGGWRMPAVLKPNK